MTGTGSTDRWHVEVAEVDGARGLQLGPYEDDVLAEQFRADARERTGPLRVHLDCRFDGERVSVQELVVRRSDGLSVTPGGLAGLGLPLLVRTVVEALGTVDTAAHVDRRPGRKPTGEELKLVAAVVAWNHATWGQPRQAVVDHWCLNPRTATRWVARASELYPMPLRDEPEA